MKRNDPFLMNERRSSGPCQDCPDRFLNYVDGVPVTCHGSCPKYQEYHERQVAKSRYISKESWLFGCCSEVCKKRPKGRFKGERKG